MSDGMAELVTQLRRPAWSLPRFGRVMDQKTDEAVAYNPHAITHDMQPTILAYMDEPPRNSLGQTLWLALLGYRQGGKSTAGEVAAYPLAAFTPGWDHVCIADRKFRADYLHRRVHFNHQHWPEAIRPPTRNTHEVRQLSFDERFGGVMRTLSMEMGAVGLGQSPNSFHFSEVPFCRDATTQWSMTYPSMINKDNVRVLFESTPAPADQPSVDFWKDICYDAKAGVGRWIYAFFPFWDGKLNQRPWPKDWVPDLEELKLYDRYHGAGLQWEHLAFRRLTIETDREIRRNPALFNVFYPFDDVSCWAGGVSGVISGHVLDRHRNDIMVPWKGPYMEYEAPEPDAIYVVGVDPTGFGARDHASFQVLKVYEGEWKQVACFADHIGDPVRFTELVVQAAQRYNRAQVVVEANGVGAATLALLERSGYSNVYYEDFGKPGKTTTSKSLPEMLGYLVDALLDDIVIRDLDTLDQLQSYRNDKLVEDSERTEVLRQETGRGKRERHHWDKVSALMMAVVGAREMPRRYKPKPADEKPANVLLFKDMTWEQQQQLRKDQTAGTPAKTPATRRSVVYRSARPPRKKR